MQNKTLLEGLAKLAGMVLFFAGLYFIAQAYTMAFHGIYIDCFVPDTPGCTLRHYAPDPTLLSALYGTVLALAALVTFYLGTRALRWVQKPGAGGKRK